MDNNKKTVLLNLCDADFKLVPAACKSKFPSVKDWRNKYFTSREVLEKYLDANPNTNMAIIPLDDWIVIDIDPRNGGNESFEKLKQYFPQTFKVATGGGGFHYYYKLPQGFKGSLGKCLKGYEGIDVKTHTGCLMAPGSTHPNGNKYRIAGDSIDEIAEVHPKLLKLAEKEQGISIRNIASVVSNVVLSKGHRNNGLAASAGSLFRKGLDFKSVLTLTLQKNKDECKPPLSYKEVFNIVKSVSRYDNYNQSQNKKQVEKAEMTISEKVEEVMITPKIKSDIKCRMICDLIIRYINENGKFYKSNSSFYVFDNMTKKLIWLDKGNHNLKRLLYTCGINPASEIFKQIVEALCAYCDINGVETEIYKYAHYDYKVNAVYLKNGDNILRITADDVTLCDNGTDKIMFTDEILVDPFEYQKDVTEDYLGKYLFDLPNYSSTTYLTKEDLKTIALIYFHSLFMPDFLRTKPIISTVGTKGSGKTSLLRMMIKAAYGKEYDVTSMTNNLADLDTIIAKRHFIVIDNLDTYRESVNDKLASYATGVVNEKRKLYSNGEVYREKVEAFVGISTRNPVFRRDDVAQRVLVIYLDSLTSFCTEDAIIDPLLQHRGEVLSQVIKNLQVILKRIKNEPVAYYKSAFRMADFAHFAALFLGSREKAEELLHNVRKTQKAIATEGDILFTFLTKFVALLDDDKWYTARILYQKLDGLALGEINDTLFKNEFRAKYENSVSLGKRLNNIKDDVSDFIKIETRKRRGNITVYRITAGPEFADWENSLM